MALQSVQTKKYIPIMSRIPTFLVNYLKNVDISDI